MARVIFRAQKWGGQHQHNETITIYKLSGAGDVEVLDEQFESGHDESRGASGSDTEPSPSPVREPRQPTSKDLGHGQRSFRDVPAEEIRELKAEGAVAKSLGLNWEQRGPPGCCCCEGEGRQEAEAQDEGQGRFEDEDEQR